MTTTLPVVDDATRRGFLTGGLSLAALLAAGSGPAGATETAAPFPRTVQTAHGPVVIPTAPERIVTLNTEGDAVVALGRVPVLMAGRFDDPTKIDPWLVDRLAGEDVELLDPFGEVPFERIAAARPDLILAGTFFEVDEHYERLSAIAPTISYVRGLRVDTWQEQTLLIGRALAEEDAARAAVAEVEARIDAVRPALEGRTITSSRYFEPGAISVSADPTDRTMAFFRSLGFVPNPAVTALPTDQGVASIGLEQLEVLESDVLLMSHASPELKEEIESNPLFTGLRVVAEGRYLPLDSKLSNTLRHPSILRAAYALDELVPDITKALQP